MFAADDAAIAAGVRYGMRAALARSLAPSARLLAREPGREAALLEALACWAGGFTPSVRVWPGQGLLLEVGGCLRLFGGLQRLAERAVAGLAAQGFHARHAAAPTARGAAWRVLAGADTTQCPDHAWPGVLDPLPLAPLASELPPGTVERLAAFGATTLGALRRLPSAALTRRIGPAALAAVGQAYGEVRESEPLFVFPQRFTLAVDLPAAVDNAPALVFAGRRLVLALAGWLELRQAGIRACRLWLGHRHSATPLPLHFAEALRDGERIAGVLRERLERLSLAAPVESLRLETGTVEALVGGSRSLFVGANGRPEGIAALVDRLRARLGDERVCGLTAVADYRAERATRSAATGGDTATLPPAPRPLWLLPCPRALRERDGRPQAHGPLTLLAGPERIESGWWDEGEALGDVRRDYYVALAGDGRWLWIFRDWRAPGGWFLHGLFA